MLTVDIASELRIATAVSRFSEYSNEIESTINRLKTDQSHYSSIQIEGILNGNAVSALQHLIPVNIRKEAGIFFTNTDLADRVATHLAPLLNRRIKLLDPACGAGNLLVACARYLPVENSLRTTLQTWSHIIGGYDLFPEFVRAARLRLILMAASRHTEENNMFDNIDINNCFPDLEVKNMISCQLIPPVTCIVVNPPFGYAPSPENCQWTTGRTQIAGLFIEKLIRNAQEGQHIVAILPDVLKSGTRYKKWRNLIVKLSASIEVEQIGRFDADTDVDVFILHAVVGNANDIQKKWPCQLPITKGLTHRVSDYFDIHVGTIVPHRDTDEGTSYPYIHTKTTHPWETLERITEERVITKRAFSPPFVTVRRTSSPSDIYRCVATIINERRKVAVENHLIVLLPKDKSLLSCRQLMKIFKTKETNEWLNQRIRCRHLTVTALKELPCNEIAT